QLSSFTYSFDILLLTPAKTSEIGIIAKARLASTCIVEVQDQIRMEATLEAAPASTKPARVAAGAREDPGTLIGPGSLAGWVAFLNTVRTEHFDQVLALRPLMAAIADAA